MDSTALDTLRWIVIVAGLFMVLAVGITGLNTPPPRRHIHWALVAFGVSVLLLHPTRFGDPEMSPALIPNMIGVALGLLYLWSLRRSDRAKERHGADC